jgi:hypothetical protein
MVLQKQDERVWTAFTWPQDRLQWRDLVHTVMNLSVPQKARNTPSQHQLLSNSLTILYNSDNITGLTVDLIRTQSSRSGVAMTTKRTGQPRQFETQVGRFGDYL